MEDNYEYAGDFYRNHGLKEEIIDGENNDADFYVRWSTPVVLDDINDVRKLTGGLYYSYRKDGNIAWQKGSTMPERFVTGYNSPSNKLVILYPIKSKETGFTEAFVQYPCGNLVCKDTDCSALKVKRTPLTCDVELEANEIYNTDTIRINMTANDPKVEFESLYVNNNKVIDKITKTNMSINKPDVGNYHIKVTAISPYNGSRISCDTNIKVKLAPFCGDNIVSQWEQCDDGNTQNGDGCNSVCKYEKPTCDAQVTRTCVENGTSIEKIFKVNRSNGVLDSILVWNKSVDKYYTFDNWGTHNVAFSYVNPLNKGVSYTCNAEVKVRSNPFCGDGILNNGEICDPNDSKTWAMCTNTCEAKVPTECWVHITGDLVKNKTMFIGVDKDYYSRIHSVKVWNKNLNVSGGDYSSFTPESGGTYTVDVTVSNKLDSNKTKTCRKTIVVEEADLCR